jgi:hypothetical protein
MASLTMGLFGLGCKNTGLGMTILAQGKQPITDVRSAMILKTERSNCSMSISANTVACRCATSKLARRQ